MTACICIAASVSIGTRFPLKRVRCSKPVATRNTSFASVREADRPATTHKKSNKSPPVEANGLISADRAHST